MKKCDLSEKVEAGENGSEDEIRTTEDEMRAAEDEMGTAEDATPKTAAELRAERRKMKRFRWVKQSILRWAVTELA